MRLKSLDVFRGIAIASMILVNNPGSWKQVYPPLDHAEWHGCTPTDLVFPFFLFIVGCAMSFSLSKYTETTTKIETNIYWRIARRAAILFVLGLLLNTSSIALDVLLNGAPVENFGKIRIMGVLQRIGLAYFISAIAIYWGVLFVFAVGGYTEYALTPEGYLGGYVDRLILGSQHLYKGGPFDPEGLLSTLPAVVTVLSGYFTGEWLRVQPIKTRTSLNLVISGLCCLVIGHLWGFLFPINKQLWTSSFVV
ncbi:MAG: DUF1624 domain-containing protein, partial [Microcoleus sp. PH2017_04_SCI_O_A]|nr:DUF1624 domain-containing protein [Microcoleus sp. PH2017_04_SCI_O_A]